MATAELLYSNIIEGATITASSTASGTSALHLPDWRPWLLWKAGAGGEFTITVDCGSAKTANTLALVAHNLGTLDAQVTVETSTDNFATVTTLVMPRYYPHDDKIIYRHFPQTTARYWRIHGYVASGAAFIGLAVLGQRLEMDQPTAGDYAPGIEDLQGEVNISQGGHMIGSTMRVPRVRAALTFKHISGSWFRSSFAAAWEHISRKPFVLCHDYGALTYDVMLATLPEDFEINGEYDPVMRRNLTLEVETVKDYWGATTNDAPDPVVLLLHMDGAHNGTTFTDSSPYARTLTRIGTPVTITSDSVFGGACASFDGDGDYVRAAPSADFTMQGAVTIEFRLKLYSYDRFVLHIGVASGDDYMEVTAAGLFRSIMFGQAISSTAPLALNRWYAIAYTRDENSFPYLFVDGVRQGIAPQTPVGARTSVPPVELGAFSQMGGQWYLHGLIDEFRFTNGLCRYTANYTPATGPF